MLINITHLYPDLLNLYGDRGNIKALVQRLKWRNIDVNVTTVEGDDIIDLLNTDILFLGGGSDREQLIVEQKLLKYQEKIKDYVNSGGVIVAVCGGYQLLGNYYKAHGETIKGLGIIDMHTEAEEKRLIGNIVMRCNIDGIEFDVVGFENHSGRTIINNGEPLGKVIKGFGNNGKDGFEGVLYKNVFGTYLHGPLFPKNPKLTDIILTRALKRKYKDFEGLTKIDDTLEEKTNKSVKELILR